jgi:release factor glutamine methyltransferase
MSEPPPELTEDLPRGIAVRTIASILAAAGIDDPLREARLLTCAGLGISPAALLLAEANPLGKDARCLAEMVARRAARVPFARIVGVREFYGLDFALSDATLIPRPDTETLVDAVLAEARARGMHDRVVTIADLGVGSGAILAALLHAMPLARGFAADLSVEALATARGNLDRLVGPARVEYHRGAWLKNVERKFDIIVSNPPYIPSAAIAGLAPEVARHDPHTALDGGSDGLDAYRSIAADMASTLKADGFLGVEIGAGQADDVTAIFAKAGMIPQSCHSDLGGHNRALLLDFGGSRTE